MHHTNRLSSLPSATGGIARLACERVRGAGKDLAGLVSRAGLTLDLIDEPSRRLDVVAQIKLLDLAAEVLRDEHLGFHLARDFDLREIGLLYYVMASSETLAAALRNAARYSTLNNEGVRLAVDLERGVAITLDYVNVARHSDRHQAEFWLGTLVRVCRRVTNSRMAPQQIRVRHYRSALPARILTFLGCEIQFGANADEIVFAASAASLRSVDADLYLNKLLLDYANEALGNRNPPRSNFRSRVEDAIVQALPHGRANVELIAGRLGMSRRTLARALAEEDITFSELLDDTRAALAKRYLSEQQLPISQIAWLLGYREASSFTNAFGRWTGSTPRKFRAA
ncbi:AraC family transcriptional regulator [Bradyrhizobium sp. BR 10289]|uniref:AraC family transcriptional regulator n=1 Tax=Bradyrhizobium sp. BR 10289 TaxID=2749993 RepID=UPI001C64C3E8|nr:AraC family transcriptional regulator [Bradyrhizobium sp. BR 10289]MBW7968884.1 AraC family transcriptional regulator ligand-binding domain-containing protein [Bradyrhizobium sp. BR 10289]